MPDTKDYVEFDAEFPDPEWERGADDVPAGQPIAAWLREQLIGRGFECSAVEDHESFGWAFLVTVSRSSAGCLLQGGEPWLLITELHVGLRDVLNRTSVKASYGALVGSIAGILAAEPRVKVREWATRREYEERARQTAEEARGAQRRAPRG